MKHQVDIQTIERVREASRKLAREFGFMGATLAATALPASAVHTLLEIDVHGPQTAADLTYKLNLEKSSVSRMLKKLIASGEIREQVCENDARVKWLYLTDQGIATVKAVHRFAQSQAKQALEQMRPESQAAVADILTQYAAALGANRVQQGWHQNANEVADKVSVVTGYKVGAIGRIAYLMSTYYEKHYNFGRYFESKIASECAEFTSRLDNPNNQLWLAVKDNEVMGSIAIDAEDLKQKGVAHLRWFMMDNQIMGQGMGRKLLKAAVEFCDANGFAEIHLWTLKGLAAASKLYDDFGFYLEKEMVDTQWGEPAIEQHRIRKAQA